MTIRCAVVPPAPAPYREPLFRSLAQRLELCVIYQSARPPGWDMPPEWFTTGHGYPARHLEAWQRPRPGRTPVVVPRGLSRALTDVDPGVVVCSEYGAASLTAFAWCRRRGRAFVVFTECTPQIDGMLSAAQLRLHRWLARHADGVIAVSSAARARLAAFGVAAERVTVALQAADLAPVRAAGAARGSGGAPLTVLTVGRLVPDKNLETLVRAVAALPAGAARLEIAGSGFLEGRLRELASDLGADVTFHGHVAPAELPPLYARADVFSLVSTYEPFGVAVREAAAAGLPIVCSRVAGAAGDVAVDGRNAVLVDPGQVGEVTAALGRLAADGELRRRMGAESRAIDAATDGREVEAFGAAVLAAYARRAGRTSSRSRRTWTSGR